MLFYTKRILKSPIFWFCFVLMVFIMLLGCYEDLPYANSENIPVLYFFIITNAVGITHVLVPVVCVMPFLYYYVDELEKRTVYYQMIRMKKKNKFIGGQILAALVSPCLIAFFSAVAFTFVCWLFGAGFRPIDMLQDYFENSMFGEMIADGHMFVVYLLHVAAFLLYSLPWVLVGMATSYVTKNKYVIIASPFIFNLAISYVTEMFSIDFLGPTSTLLKGDVIYFPFGGIYYALCYHFVLIMFLGTVISVVFRRRLSHGGF